MESGDRGKRGDLWMQEEAVLPGRAVGANEEIKPLAETDAFQLIQQLEPKQQAFLAEYMKDFNGTQAAIRAGYSERSASEQAARMLAKDNFQTIIKAIVNERIMKADELLIRLSDQARSDYSDFIEIDEDGNARINFLRAKSKGRLHLIKKIKQTTKERRTKSGTDVETILELELLDSQAALAMLMKPLGLNKEVLTLVGKDDGPVQVEGKVEVTADQFAAIAKQIESWRRDRMASTVVTAPKSAQIASDSAAGPA